MVALTQRILQRLIFLSFCGVVNIYRGVGLTNVIKQPSSPVSLYHWSQFSFESIGFQPFIGNCWEVINRHLKKTQKQKTKKPDKGSNRDAMDWRTFMWILRDKQVMNGVNMGENSLWGSTPHCLSLTVIRDPISD